MNRIRDILKRNIYLVLLYRFFLLFVIYSICRLLFYGFNMSHFAGLHGKELFRVFIAGLLFDASAIVYINLLYIVLFLLPFKFRHNKTYQLVLMVLFFSTNGIALIANFADIAYYEYVLQRTTMDVFAQFKNEENMGILSLRFLWDYWYLTLLWIMLMVSLVFLYRKVKVGPARIKSGILYFFSGTFMFVLFGILVVGGARGGFKHFTQPISMNSAWAYVKKPEYASIVLNTPFTLIHSVEKKGFERVKYFASEEELDSIYTPVHKASGNPPKKENVVIIVVESLNKEFVGSLNKDLEGGKYQGFTPFLDSLVSVGKVYRYSYANGRKSIDMLPSIFCSIPRVGIPYVLMTPYYKDHLNSLPGLMKEKGYKSAFFHGAPNGSFGFQSFTHIIGFDEYYGMTEYNNPADFDGSWGIWDEEFLQYFASCIDTFSTPFIASLFTVTSHHPFELPVKYKGRFTRGESPQEKCIEYTDYSLRRFFEKASTMSWYKNTLFVITADHVSINQRDEFKNDIGYFSVPIIFFKPGSGMNGEDPVIIAQQTDIMPTLLNYLGYDKDYVAFGKDLFHPVDKNYAFNSLNDTYHLFMNDKLMIFNGKDINLFTQMDSPHSAFKLGPGEKQSERDSMQLFLEAFIQQYVNRMIDDRLTIAN